MGRSGFAGDRVARQEMTLQPASSRPLRIKLWLGLILAVGLWPWIPTLGLWPMAADSPSWFELSDPATEGWIEWVFSTRHFNVGYRPLTAATFAATTAIADGSALLARLVDLGLHALAAVGTYALGRALAPGRVALAGLCSMAVFLLHPLADEVVPVLARRSYSLSLALSTWGLVALLGAIRAPERQRRWFLGALAGDLFALAFLSNEVGAIPALASPLILLSVSGVDRAGARSAASALALAAVPVLLALGWRSYVLGGLGGYEVDGGEAAGGMTIIAASLRQLLGCARGQPLAGVIGPWSATIVVTACMGFTASLARRAGVSPLHWRLMGLLGWLAVGMGTYAALGVVFSRQLYPLTVPLALLIGIPLGTLLANSKSSTRWGGITASVIASGGMLLASPVLHGQDSARLELWMEKQAIMESIVLEGRQLAEPATVQLIVPGLERGGRRGGSRLHAVEARRGGRKRALVRWARFQLRDRDVLLEERLEWSGGDGEPGPVPALVEVEGELWLTLPEGTEARRVGGRSATWSGPEKIALRPTPGGIRADHAFLWADGQGVLMPVPAR